MTTYEQLLKQLVDWARSQDEILAIYLYGSHAEGRAGTLSDVDVGVLARDDLSAEQIWRLEDRWASEWPEAVDLRVLNLAPLAVRYEVTARGRRLWAFDVGQVANLESLMWRRYWDQHPRLEHDWQQHVSRVLEERDEPERQEYQATLAKVRAVHRRVREAAAVYALDLQD